MQPMEDSFLGSVAEGRGSTEDLRGKMNNREHICAEDLMRAWIAVAAMIPGAYVSHGR